MPDKVNLGERCLEELARRLRPRVEAYREEMIDFQRRLTAVPAIGPDNGGEGEWERSQFLLGFLKEIGLSDIRQFDAPDDRVPSGRRPNLVVRHTGRGDRPATVVLSHMDTVPPGDEAGWSGNPFELRVQGDRLTGRGVEDNQQGLAASVFGLRALVEEGLTPSGDVVLLLVADEETGNRFGIDFLLRQHPDLVRPGDYVVVPDFGLPDGLAIEIAEKGQIGIELVVRGRQTHASMPDQGLNANRIAAHLTVRLDQRLAQAFSEQDLTFDPPRSTFEPTKRDANVANGNTIPGIERLYFDCRVLPSHRLAAVKALSQQVAAEVEQEFGAHIEVSFPVDRPAAPPTPKDAPVIRAVSSGLFAARGRRARTIGIGGGTVAAAFRRKGLPVAVWSTMEDTAHQADEYALASNVVEDALVLALVYMVDLA